MQLMVWMVLVVMIGIVLKYISTTSLSVAIGVTDYYECTHHDIKIIVVCPCVCALPRMRPLREVSGNDLIPRNKRL